MNDIFKGITIGAAGGAIAGLTVWIVQFVREKSLELTHRRRIYRWLQANTEDEPGQESKTTKEIASWTNLTAAGA